MKTLALLILSLLTASAFANAKKELPTLHNYFIKGEVLNIAKAQFSQEVETGAYLTKDLYVKVRGERKPGNDWGMDETVGLQKQMGKYTPYLELSYNYDGTTKLRQWRKNGHYALGLKRTLGKDWGVYVEANDIASHNKDVGGGLNYKINSSYTLGVDYSYKLKSKNHTLGVCAEYLF